MARKSSHLTLLEVMISFFLLGALLFVLIFTFRDYSLSSVNIEKDKQIFLRKSLFNLILKRHLLCLEDDPTLFFVDSYKDSLQPALFFSLKEDLDIEEAFSKGNRIVLFIDFEKKMILRSIGDDKKIRDRVVYENVDKVDYIFFHPLSQTWQSQWKQESVWPDLFKISIKDISCKEKTIFAFEYPRSRPVIYEKI
ncbi:MAG: hypothetical protein ACOVOR_00515 [Rhabdochlamydiaceae bacterium]